MQYKFKANIWAWYDNSHLIGLAWGNLLRDMGLWDFILLMLLCWSHAFGPRKDDERFAQCRAGMEQFVQQWVAGNYTVVY